MFNRTMRMVTGAAIFAPALALITAAPGVAQAQASYSVVDLGSAGAKAINRNGQVTGVMGFTVKGKTQSCAFLWSASHNTFKNLGVVKGHDFSDGFALNGLGDVCGYGGSTRTAGAYYPIYVPFGGVAQTVGATSTTFGYAYGVNDSQEVVGYSGAGAFLSKVVNGRRKVFVIGPGWARAINTSGQIVVTDSSFYSPSGYLWTPSGAAGQGTSVATPASYGPRQLNNEGAVAGYRIYQVDNAGGPIDATRPVAYFPGGPIGEASSWLDIPWPSAPPQGQWSEGGVGGINGSGVVVGSADAYDESVAGGVYLGSTAWIWDSTNGTRNLNTLIDPASGWVLTSASGINDSGWIIGAGTLNGAARNFVLKPN
jgi:hypothetical protein